MSFVLLDYFLLNLECIDQFLSILLYYLGSCNTNRQLVKFQVQFPHCLFVLSLSRRR